MRFRQTSKKSHTHAFHIKHAFCNTHYYIFTAYHNRFHFHIIPLVLLSFLFSSGLKHIKYKGQQYYRVMFSVATPNTHFLNNYSIIFTAQLPENLIYILQLNRGSYIFLFSFTFTCQLNSSIHYYFFSQSLTFFFEIYQ